MNIGRYLLLFLSGLILLTGCGRQGPDPDDTFALGSPSRPDWVTGSGDGAEFAAGLDADSGLTMRDSTLGNEQRGILSSIFFDFDSSAIRASDRARLNEAFTHLQRNPTHRLIIEGHCDYKGTEEYNMALGDRRARSAKDYLLSLGADAGRISVRSMGDTQSVRGASDQQRAQDRRGDFIVVLPE